MINPANEKLPAMVEASGQDLGRAPVEERIWTLIKPVPNPD